MGPHGAPPETCKQERPGPAPRAAHPLCSEVLPTQQTAQTRPPRPAAQGPTTAPAAMGPGAQRVVSDCPTSTQDQPQKANTPQPPTQVAPPSSPPPASPGPQPPAGHLHGPLSAVTFSHSSACPGVLATGLSSAVGTGGFCSRPQRGSEVGPAPGTLHCCPGPVTQAAGRLFPEVAFAGEGLPVHPSKQSGPVRTLGQAAPERRWQAVGDAHVSEVTAWVLPGHFLIPTKSHVLR